MDDKQAFVCLNCEFEITSDEHYVENLNWLYIPYVYGDEVQHVVHRFKYGGAKALAKPMARAIYSRFPDVYGDFLLPVPLHPNRQRDRGFNQASELALELSLLLKIPAMDGLSRLRDTEKQFHLSREQRASNLADAIGVKQGFDVVGKRIILVDDVFTTGSTAVECAKVLKSAGATHVDLIAFARA